MDTNTYYDIRKDIETSNYIKFSIWSSPQNNNINFIKLNKNKITKRVYADAEILFGNRITRDYKYIENFFNKKGIISSKLVILSNIRIIKTQYNTRTNKSYTMLNKRNTIKTNKREKYFNKISYKYILSKGYGKILLEYIEQYLKSKGYEYLVLIPSSKSIIGYYLKSKYIQNITNLEVNENYNKYIQHINNEYVSPNVIMYKKI
jgi:hypothetical protein